ncbi:MAG: Mrp/NBP35 family ATP-binding protein [Methanobacteriaceae archaeon]|nr:Mrp/NBP35 family ATP-binding protein [Methanobacteriaceae archaeon]
MTNEEHNCGNHGGHGNMDPEQQKAMMQQNINITKNMANIKYKIAVMSGKGGVGKSTVAVNLAAAFNTQGLKTGIFDVDIHGPNIPKMLGVEDQKLDVIDHKLKPVTTENGLQVASMAFLLQSNGSPIIWRGPQKTGAIKELMAEVAWDNLDVLIIDHPPGTGDEPLTVLQSIPDLDAVVMVTTPNSVSHEDVIKCVAMTKMLKVENIGLVENMSYFVCPDCNKKSYIFGESSGKTFAKDMDVKFLGSLPLVPEVSTSANEDIPIVEKDKDSIVSKEFMNITKEIENLFFDKE